MLTESARQTDPIGPLETERLELRPWTTAEEDLESGLEIFGDRAVMRWVGSGRTAADTEEIERWVKRRNVGADGLAPGMGFRAIVPRGARRPIGSIGLFPLDGSRRIEIGYHLARRAWNFGYATEAARALARGAFDSLGLDELCAVTYIENTASRRVLEKTGLDYRGLAFAYSNECSFYEARRASWLRAES